MFAGNFAPAGWNFCQGQLLAIADFETLFNLIGTTYGGDGTTNFALPNLQSRVPIHLGTDSFGNNYVIGEAGGVETVTLTTQQIPQHGHVPQCNSTSGTAAGPGGNVWAVPNPSVNIYNTVAPSLAMDAGAIGSSGGSQPHDNMVPFLVINFIISMFGIFPSQT
jgi:microcystin-dependent protein